MVCQPGIIGLYGRFDGFANGSKGWAERHGGDTADRPLTAQRQMDTLLCSQILLGQNRFDPGQLIFQVGDHEL